MTTTIKRAAIIILLVLFLAKCVDHVLAQDGPPINRGYAMNLPLLVKGDGEVFILPPDQLDPVGPPVDVTVDYANMGSGWLLIHGFLSNDCYEALIHVHLYDVGKVLPGCTISVYPYRNTLAECVDCEKEFTIFQPSGGLEILDCEVTTNDFLEVLE